MVMSRESRKIFNELDRLATVAGVQGLIIPAHIYICDLLTLKYYASPVVNLIKQRLKSVKKLEWKHFTIEYWLPVINNMFKDNTSAANKQINGMIYEQSECNGSYIHIINEFLLTDYSIQDSFMIHEIVNTFTVDSVINACKIAKQADVYSIQYVHAVLLKEQAIQQVHERKMDNLNDKITQSDRLLNTEVHTHSIMELAMMEYEYNKKMENARLERLFDNMIGGKTI